MHNRHARTFVTVVGLAVLVVVMIRTAWVCDDAYITFRTSDNFVHGYGLRWNVAERVQSYTHPLWMLVFTAAYAITHDAYYTSIALGMIFSAGAMLLIAGRLALTPWHAVVALSGLLSSKAFVDFSTSGLETALTYLLLVLFLWAYWDTPPAPRRFARLSLITSLCLLNRADLIFLLAPPLVVDFYRAGRHLPVWSVAAGALPLVGWELFSVIYYGFPLSNTAYAKLLGAAVPWFDLLRKGVFYGHATALFDPVTIAIILSSPLAIAAPGQRRSWPIVAGIVAQGLYVTAIGGDFMFGRFYTPMVLWSAALWARAAWISSRPTALVATAACLLLGLAAADQPALLSGPGGWTPFPRDHWFYGESIDERSGYFATTGLLNQRPGELKPRHELARIGSDLAAENRRMVTRIANVGFSGYFAGPNVHIIDPFGLTDPLLARLPPDWPARIGHFSRKVPAGYQQTLESGINQIADPDLHRFYDRLHVIVAGPIWRVERWQYIAFMLAGRYDDEIRRYASRQAAASSPASAGSPGTTTTGS